MRGNPGSLSRALKGGVLLSLLAAGTVRAGPLEVGVQRPDRWEPLVSIRSADEAVSLHKLKRSRSRERDLLSQTVVVWDGVKFSELLDRALEKLPPEERARIDLLAVRSGGREQLVPRFMVTRFGFWLADRREGAGLGPRGPFALVPPWSTQPKVESEGVPVRAFFLDRLERVELTSYGARFAAFQLKSQTEPTAMRGQKLFLQNCLSCHGPSLQPGAAADRTLASEKGHPTVPGFTRLGDRERRALGDYFKALP